MNKRKLLFVFVASIMALNVLRASSRMSVPVGTWATASQLITPDNMPPAPGLAHNSLRQVVRVSLGGENLQVKLSNDYGESQLEIKSVYIALSKGGSNIDASTAKYLTFDKKRNITIKASSSVISDSITFKLPPLRELTITINYGETPKVITGHPGSRTTSFLTQGTSTPKSDFSHAVTTDHWYTISGIDVDAKAGACVAVLGNSITDGRGSTTNGQNRWTDVLATCLQQNTSTKNVGVLNLGIGGNSVVRGGLGDPALKRFQRDILSQNGVKWLIIYEGVNDLGWCNDGKAMAKELIAAYQKMITKAHACGILVYGATITPVKNHSYFTEEHELGRAAVNQWIRNSGWFDEVIDFDSILRDKNDLLKIDDKWQSDYLHPNEMGYERMGKNVNVDLFTKTQEVQSQKPKDK